MSNGDNLRRLKTLAKSTLNKLDNPFDLNDLVALVRDGELNTSREVEVFIHAVHAHVNTIKYEMLEYLEDRCVEHKYGEWTFTVQRRLIGYSTVYARVCMHCDKKVEVYDTTPDGAENAKEQYYNNDI